VIIMMDVRARFATPGLILASEAMNRQPREWLI